LALVHVDGIDFFLRQFLLGFQSVASVHVRFSPNSFWVTVDGRKWVTVYGRKLWAETILALILDLILDRDLQPHT
jgi:hypothetical protein